MHYKIEPARFEHLPWLRMLFMRWCIEQAFPYPEQEESDADNFVLAVAEKIRTADPNFQVLVAIKGRRVVGFIGSDIYTRLFGKPKTFARGLWLYVVPKHRSHGCATQLMQVGIGWLRSKGVTHLEADEMGTSDEWERRGFHVYMKKYFIPLDEFEAISRAHTDKPAPKSNGHDTTVSALSTEHRLDG